MVLDNLADFIVNKLWYSDCVLEEVTICCQHLELSMSLKIHSAEPINGLYNLMGSLGGPENPLGGGIFFFMESISILKVATNLKKRLKKFKDN